MIAFETENDCINYMREWLKKHDFYDKFLNYSMLYIDSNFDIYCHYVYIDYILYNRDIYCFHSFFFSFLENNLKLETHRIFFELSKILLNDLINNSLSERKYWND